MEKWLADMAAGEPSEDEIRLRQADGGYRWFLVRTVPLRDELGNIVKWFGTSTDIEDRKHAEDALQCSLDELRALAARLQSVREDERTRVARELHDELGQALTAIKFELASLIRELPADTKRQSIRIESIIKLADQTIGAVQRISTELRPGVLDDLGLMAAIEWAAEEFQRRTGTTCRLDLPEDDIVIDRERATALFRILQETLTNVARHANATQVKVRLAKEEGSLILEVHDNGKGISKEELSAGRSLGILGMRERALLLGGGLAISGAPGQGTTIEVRIHETYYRKAE
jgi:signal transduction histidine kinase